MFVDDCVNLSSVLPFYRLSDHEFNFVIGSWSLDPAHINTDLFDLIPNPDKFDECDPDRIFPLPLSDYLSVSKMNTSFKRLGQGHFPCCTAILEVCLRT